MFKCKYCGHSYSKPNLCVSALRPVNYELGRWEPLSKHIGNHPNRAPNLEIWVIKGTKKSFEIAGTIQLCDGCKRLFPGPKILKEEKKIKREISSRRVSRGRKSVIR